MDKQLSFNTVNPVAISALVDFCRTYSNLFVLTGAGCSTGSGIPDYRDENGKWKNARPVQFHDFLKHTKTRQRYWARSKLGWQRIDSARPNTAHTELVKLEAKGLVQLIITQNVDGLHQKAGSQKVLDLHGNLRQVICLDCGHRVARSTIQHELTRDDPLANQSITEIRPDGDAYSDDIDESNMVVPNCKQCGGILKPDVVFFGESVPKQRVDFAKQKLSQADALLVIGSSLMVYSGYRFCKWAKQLNKPIAIINHGNTRADEIVNLKLSTEIGQTLSGLNHYL